MKGIDLLDKLENLDPGLVAGAAEPPREKARRRGFEWGGLLAAAACIVAIALPLLLTYLINGVTPTIEYGPGSRHGSTSHQVSVGDEGPGGGDGLGDPQKGAHKGEGGGYENSIYYMEPQVSVMGYKDYITWTRYTLDEQYCAVYPEGLPAEEYFKYNRQEPESGSRLTSAAWNDSLLDEYGFYPFITTPGNKEKYAKGEWGAAHPSEVMDKYAERIFECLPEYLRPLSSIFLCSPDGDGLSFARILTASEPYFDVTDDSLRQSWNICVTLSREPPLTDNALASAKYDYNETVVIPSEGAEPITALGGLNTNRMLLCTLPNGMWCRIAGNFNVPYEDMVKLLNSLLSDTSALDEIDEKLAGGELVPVTREEMNAGYISPSASPDPNLEPDPDPLANYNPDVHPYIPTPETNDYAAPIGGTGAGLTGRAGQNQNEQKVLGLEVSYLEGYDGRPLERYAIDRLDSYEGKNESMGTLAGLTRDEVEKEYNRQRGAMGAERSADVYKMDQPMHYTFNFTWDDYYVTAVFSEELTADGLWSFLQQLSGKETAIGTDAYTAPLLAAG